MKIPIKIQKFLKFNSKILKQLEIYPTIDSPSKYLKKLIESKIPKLKYYHYISIYLSFLLKHLLHSFLNEKFKFLQAKHTQSPFLPASGLLTSAKMPSIFFESLLTLFPSIILGWFVATGVVLIGTFIKLKSSLLDFVYNCVFSSMNINRAELNKDEVSPRIDEHLLQELLNAKFKLEHLLQFQSP